MPSVVHVLPHPGDGAETYAEVLSGMDDWRQLRIPLVEDRRPAAAALDIPRRLPGIARHARHADITHLHGEVASIACLAILRSRPSVVTTHGLHLLRRMAHARRRRAAELALRAIVSAADRTICVSDSEAGELARVLPRHLTTKLVTVHNGIELPAAAGPGEWREARAALGLAPDAVAFLYVGQLEERKDPLVAVRAAVMAREQGAPVELLVVGDGPLEPEVSAEATSGVRILGRRSDVNRLMLAADVFVLPSRREGLPYAVLEAMTFELPVVAADVPGSIEAVGEAGLVLPVGQVEAFAAAFRRLASDRDERARLGQLARERVARTFSAREMIDRTREVYEEVVSRRCSADGP